MTTPAKTASVPLPFNSAQQAALDALMDLLIPASHDGRMPAARALRLFGSGTPLRAADRTLFEQGLADLDARAREAHGAPFAQLNTAQAKALVDTLRAENPAFVQSVVTQTVGRYLAHPLVMPLLGLEARPPWPQGNVVTEGDWSMLDVVKRREKIYRKV